MESAELLGRLFLFPLRYSYSMAISLTTDSLPLLPPSPPPLPCCIDTPVDTDSLPPPPPNIKPLGVRVLDCVLI